MKHTYPQTLFGNKKSVPYLEKGKNDYIKLQTLKAKEKIQQ